MFMMKNGKPIIFGLAIGIIAYELLNKNSFKKQIKHNVTMTQYRNRLSEFFDKDGIDKAITDMNEYIGYGLSPQAAFDLMVACDL